MLICIFSGKFFRPSWNRLAETKQKTSLDCEWSLGSGCTQRNALMYISAATVYLYTCSHCHLQISFESSDKGLCSQPGCTGGATPNLHNLTHRRTKHKQQLVPSAGSRAPTHTGGLFVVALTIDADYCRIWNTQYIIYKIHRKMLFDLHLYSFFFSVLFTSIMNYYFK